MPMIRFELAQFFDHSYLQLLPSKPTCGAIMSRYKSSSYDSIHLLKVTYYPRHLFLVCVEPATDIHIKRRRPVTRST